MAIETARHLNASSFHALGFGLYASASIADLLERFCRYGAILSASADFKVDYSSRNVIFHLIDQRPVRSHLAPIVLLLFLLRVLRELAGDTVVPLEISVPWDEDEFTQAMRTATLTPLVYNFKHYTMIFDRQEAERPLPSANAELASFQDRLCRDYLASLDEHAHLPSRVRLKIVQALANDRVGIGQVASSLHMSRRSLQRKLQEEGTSFRAILNEARRELAEAYAMNMDLSATQISYLLGFSNPAQFTTTFRNWHGMTFRKYRQQAVFEDR